MRSYPNRPFLALGLLLLAAGSAAAQANLVNTRVEASDRLAVFYVDGTPYQGSATFSWPAGTKHILEVRGLSQVVFDERSRLSFKAWRDSAGLISAANTATLNVTASASLPVVYVDFVLEYRLDFYFHKAIMFPAGGYLGTWPGNILVNGQCVTFDSSVWVERNNALVLQATPSPGYVFLGWDTVGGGSTSFVQRYVVTGPMVFRGLFQLASRATFQTVPEELEVLVNRQRVRTVPAGQWCGTMDSPYDGPAQYPPPSEPVLSTGVCRMFMLCSGTMEFAPGETILLGAEAQQVDPNGGGWVFDSWELPGGVIEKKNNVTYRIPGAPSWIFPKARFVRAAQVLFRTNPRDLKLVVDGGESAKGLYFFGPGSTHRVAAPKEQADSKGRKYRFVAWSNGGPAEQDVTIPLDAADKPFVLEAQYELLGQLTLRSEPPGAVLQVDGAECHTPCTFDRPAGNSLGISAPALRPVSEDSRWEFRGWSDGGGAARNFTFTSNAVNLTARYEYQYRLVVAAEPPEGASFRIQPSSADGFHAQGSRVTIDVEAVPGYKFRRWDGVVSGTATATEVLMNAPAVVIARLEKAPFVPPTGVRSAAGETVDGAVAPGSVIEILGVNLVKEYEEAKTNPLPQSLQGVTVTVGGWWLPIVSVAPEAIRAQLPPDLPEGEQKLTVTLSGQAPLEASFKTARNAPAIFLQTDREPAIAFATKENGQLVTADNPAKAGEVVSLWGVGFGPINPAPMTGFKTPLNPPYPLADTLELVTGDRTWPHLFAGAVPDQVGLSLVRFRIDPAMPRPGLLELVVRINGKSSPAVRLPVQ